MSARVVVAYAILGTFALAVLALVVWALDYITGWWWAGPLLIALMVVVGATKWALDTVEEEARYGRRW